MNDIQDIVKELENVRGTGANKIFTMYLNTDLSDPDQQSGEWKIHLKNGLNNFEHYLKEADNEEELKNYKKVKKQVKAFMDEIERDLMRGVIIVASADGEVWIAERVQMHLENEFEWQETPVLDQLKSLSEKYPKTGIILVQQNQVKLIDSNLNQVKDTAEYELDVEEDTWKMKQGPRHGRAKQGMGANSVQKDLFNDRYEANQYRWYKSIAPKLDKQAKDREWKRIFIVGEAPASKTLETEMNKDVEEVILKNMLDHEESKVLETILD
ncbi:VLRF1 family aeRF1-type release factor [Oceanobacillus jeddahense]|uniref:VLRF1 family aeRF1-type release factor n=1 Tax=Oceanobacillus jeddahense TaxID=1462527 RepID=A0ABY5JQ98_9BACI|nr:VLRF1 family aeRF1-type release factor [Oceanobacillus jeddahense]UUI01990.1 VLRF1 family aeRF1-type release factor [Oceanobacillus jeddahense]